MINQNDDTKDTINKDELEPAEQTEEVILEGDSDQDAFCADGRKARQVQ